MKYKKLSSMGMNKKIKLSAITESMETTDFFQVTLSTNKKKTKAI